MAQKIRDTDGIFKDPKKSKSARKISDLIDAVRNGSGREFKIEDDLNQLIEPIYDIVEIAKSRQHAHFGRKNDKGERVGFILDKSNYLAAAPAPTNGVMYVFVKAIMNDVEVEVGVKDKNGQNINVKVTALNDLYKYAEIITYTVGHL
jgi:hypothetical protein